MLGEVAASLQLGKHPEHRQEVFHLGRVRGPVEQASLHGGFELLVELVDVGVGRDEIAGGFPVRAHKSMGGTRHGILHESEELNHMPIDEREVDRSRWAPSHGEVLAVDGSS